jgi:hypothetical protein
MKTYVKWRCCSTNSVARYEVVENAHIHSPTALSPGKLQADLVVPYSRSGLCGVNKNLLSLLEMKLQSHS